jgi:ATP-dependent helicase/nuclease subunit A
MPQDTVHQTVQTGLDDPVTVRDLDPNVQQRKASRPEDSVWVTASAGTGKTKVLTDRVLRLLLPRETGEPGTPASRILCLTFTKAGAGEMALRLTDTLAKWAVMALDHPDDNQSLRFRLRRLLNREPSQFDISAARCLFTEVSDTPGGLKIMTIHSFCQSVLGRFPLEAGIPPHFKPLEDGDARALLQQARDRIITQAAKSGPLHAALERIARILNEDQFFDLIQDLAREREQLKNILEKFNSIEGIYKKLCDELALPPGRGSADMLRDACDSASLDEPALRAACRALAGSKGKKEPEWAVQIQKWLDSSPQERISNFSAWSSIFLTTEGTAREKDFPTKSIGQNFPDCINALRQESRRLVQFIDRLNAAASAELTHDLLLLGDAIITEYQNLKKERAALDYDDLIFMTCALLESRGPDLKGDSAAAWVLYKLDQGLDHILVDEAQDTNPEQWRIVEALTAEFASGLGASDVTRTLFVVGDGKQSIYSFQRASRELFDSMHTRLGGKITAGGKNFEEVPLNISFRSSESVLNAVDAVFGGFLQNGVSPTPVKHESFRRGQAGRVELWPLCTTPPKQDIDPWAPPVEIIESTDGASALAAKIADQVKSWIDNEDLPSRGRKIKAGDIMILLRTRNAFFALITKALKDKKIPVSGADRMILNEQIAVQDLVAFAAFALQPLDSLTLACILKSPLIGMNEEALFDLAHARENTPLWNALIQSRHTDIKNYLNDIISNARMLRPYDFFTHLLQSPCPADEQSGLRALQKRLGADSIDPIDEFLNVALDFEISHIPSLQHFLHWQAGEDKEIKREMNEPGNFVRIMTIHGAKGLQAPIVILPDTVRTRRGAAAKASRRLLWPDKTGLEIPLWSPRSEMSFTEFDTAMKALDTRDDEEYRRLLYVAMTRAEDRLYLGGYAGRQNSTIESWYDAFHPALANLPGIETLDDGILRLENKQVRDPDGKEKPKDKTLKEKPLPEFFFKAAPYEKSPAAPLRPSHLETTEPPVFSPLQGDNTHRFRRGNLTHKLLEFLPSLTMEKREKAASDFLTRFAADLPAEMRNSIAAETLNILGNIEFAPVFGPGSLAEVPVTGKLADGRAISGQIDRLLITDNEILIVDYKTNRPPPLLRKDVPKIYESQMAAYAEALQQIYPDRTISCALLWTDGPRLMKI